MEEGLGLHKKRDIRAENLGKNFLGRLHQALGPTSLLCLETVHIHGQLGSALNFGQIKKFPAFELRAIRKVCVFGQGVVLPPAGGINRGAPPHTRCTVEIEKSSAARASSMLDHEMPVEQNRFNAREQGIVAVEIRPAR